MPCEHLAHGVCPLARWLNFHTQLQGMQNYGLFGVFIDHGFTAASWSSNCVSSDEEGVICVHSVRNDL